MEIEEVKKISEYDEYTINEFVRGLVKARNDEKIAREELSIRADDVTAKLQDVEKEITREELHKNEEEIENIKQEKNKIERNISEWEKEKEKILGRLAKEKEEKENKISENEKEIESLENEIKANEEKMNDLDKESKEYQELEKENNEMRNKISLAKEEITKYDEKKSSIIEIIKNLETENVIEGLIPPKTIDKEKTSSENNKSEENEEKTENPEKTDEISSLEGQVKDSAQRMKEYKENGNYELEAEEHAYYNELIKKLSSLKARNEKTVKENEAKVEVEQNEPEQATTETKVEEPEQTAKATRTTVQQPEQTAKQKVQWNSKLTPKQIEELIAEGIEPGDNEYNLYLWNHGINPFESQMKAKATQKTEVDEVLQKYKNDGFGKNAFGWYFNPWTSEYDKEYDPHKDPEYNDKIARESKTTTKTKEEKETATEEPKAEKLSLKQRIKNLFNRIKDTIKRYIDNFNNKKLPEGTEKQTQDLSEQERAEYVAKANEVLEETLSTENVLNQNTRRAMQGRNDFVSKVHISDDLMQKIENGEQPKTEEIDQEER